MSSIEDGARRDRTAPAIYLIDGMPGAGKTTFGVHVAHRLASRYPDGALFLNLWGHTPGQTPRDPFDALYALLLDVGVDAGVLGGYTTLDDRARLWRSLLANRRVLILLDDALSHQQVTPLLPRSSGSLVLITSRNRLPELDGALPATLGVLPPQDSALMLCGLARCDHDAEIGRLAELCGRLPLAISIAASQLRAHPTWPVRHLADILEHHLGTDEDILGELGHGDRSLRAAFDTSLHDLLPDLRTVFVLLGVHPGPEIDAPVAAALTDTTPTLARRSLHALHDRHLLQETAPGRFRLHDLLRAYARGLAAALDPDSHQQATKRFLDYYLHTAHTASRHLPARRTRRAWPDPARPPHPTPISDHTHATSWLTTELPTLLAAVEHTHTTHPTHTLRLTASLYPYFRAVGHWSHARTALYTAHAAATRLGDIPAQAATLGDLGYVYRRWGDLDAAVHCQNRALKLHTRTGDLTGQADALGDLGYAHQLRGELDIALSVLARAAELLARRGDSLPHANALTDLGRVRLLRGELSEAAEILNQALDIYSRSRDPQAQANALTTLGLVYLQQDDAATALHMHTTALNLHTARGDLVGKANAHLGLGATHHQLGDPAPAHHHLHHALTLFTQANDTDGRAETHNALGNLSEDFPEMGEAANHYSTALHLARTCGSKLHQAKALAGQARWGLLRE